MKKEQITLFSLDLGVCPQCGSTDVRQGQECVCQECGLIYAVILVVLRHGEAKP